MDPLPESFSLEHKGLQVLLPFEADPTTLMQVAEDTYSGLRVVRFPVLPPSDAVLIGDQQQVASQAVEVLVSKKRGAHPPHVDRGLFNLVSGSSAALQHLSFEWHDGTRSAFNAAAYPLGATLAIRGLTYDLLRASGMPLRHWATLQPGQHVTMAAVRVLADLPLPGAYDGTGLCAALAATFGESDAARAAAVASAGRAAAPATPETGAAVPPHAAAAALGGPSWAWAQPLVQAQPQGQAAHGSAGVPSAAATWSQHPPSQQPPQQQQQQGQQQGQQQQPQQQQQQQLHGPQQHSSADRLFLLRKAGRSRLPKATKTLHVESPAGGSFSVRFAPYWMVGDVKEKIREREGVPIGDQRLVHAGRALESGALLSDCSVHHNSTVALEMRVAAAEGAAAAGGEAQHAAAGASTSARGGGGGGDPPSPAAVYFARRRDRGLRPAPEYQIYIKDLIGGTHALDVSREWLVGDVMVAVEARMGIPIDKQRLLFAGQQLEDGRALASYRIHAESTLHLVLRLLED